MKVIKIDVSRCRSAKDLYTTLLGTLDAPGWHGHNLDALWDSITSDINGVSPPYLIEVTGHDHLSQEMAEHLLRIKSVFEDAGDREHVDVGLRLT